MRKGLLILASIFIGSLGASQAMAASVCDAVAGNLVDNCGFETGISPTGRSAALPTIRR